MNLDVNSPVEIYNEEDFGEYCGFDVFFKRQKTFLPSSVSHFLAKNMQKKYLYYMHKK